MAVVHGWGASARCPSAHDHQHTKRSLAETVINNEVIFLVGYEWSTHFSKKKKIVQSNLVQCNIILRSENVPKLAKMRRAVLC